MIEGGPYSFEVQVVTAFTTKRRSSILRECGDSTESKTILLNWSSSAACAGNAEAVTGSPLNVMFPEFEKQRNRFALQL